MSAERLAVERAVVCLGGREYTKRDAARVILGYADITTAAGDVRPGPLVRPGRWRQSFALQLVFALRGLL